MPAKKPTRPKLKLDKEVVRQLMDAELKRVVGGTDVLAEMCGSKDRVCSVGCTEPLSCVGSCINQCTDSQTC